MPRHPIELAKKQYEELPVVLKQALFSAEIAEQMFEIGKKFGLTIEKTGIMAEETGYIMLGLTRPNELVANLANELAISTEKAQDIAVEINHEIFFPLREELKRTHDFDMEASRIASAPQITTISGMQMPPGISSSASLGTSKTLVEEKSPLVSDLTRVKETNTSVPATPAPPYQGMGKGEIKPLSTPARPPSFQPPASPTGRIADLQKMVEKPALPVAIAPLLEPKFPSSALPKKQLAGTTPEVPRPAPEPFTSPSRKIADLKTAPEKKDIPAVLSVVSPVEPWEKDLEKEVSSLLKPLPLDLRSQQKPEAAPIPAKIPPIDLRKTVAPQSQPPITTPTPTETPQITPTPPVLPRMTPQMQDLRTTNITGPTLLEEKLRSEPSPTLPRKIPTIAPAQPSEISPETTALKNSASSDPYREPIEEDQP